MYFTPSAFSAASGVSEVRLPKHSSFTPFYLSVTEQVLHKEVLQIPLETI